jgi:ABC-type transporter Mla subunit MlaD
MSSVHFIDGQHYVEVNRKANIGDYVTRNSILRTVTRIDEEWDSVEFDSYVDEENDYVCGWGTGSYKTLEPLEAVASMADVYGIRYSPRDKEVTVEQSQASPQVTDLLANLARRVSSLEQQLSATQSNVENLAEELANVKHLTESNEQDIAMLDERTQPTEEPVTPDESIPQYWAEALIKFYGGNR